MENKGLLIFIIIVMVLGILGAIKSTKIDNCLTEIAKEICLKKGMELHKIGGYIEHKYFQCLDFNEREIGDNFLFLKSEKESCI